MGLAGGVKQASHLLKYDSTLGTFDADVKVVDDTTIAVNGKPIKIVSSRDPLALPWKDNNIDLVIEGTGVFVSSEGAGKHIAVSRLSFLVSSSLFKCLSKCLPFGGTRFNSMILPCVL